MSVMEGLSFALYTSNSHIWLPKWLPTPTALHPTIHHSRVWGGGNLGTGGNTFTLGYQVPGGQSATKGVWEFGSSFPTEVGTHHWFLIDGMGSAVRTAELWLPPAVSSDHCRVLWAFWGSAVMAMKTVFSIKTHTDVAEASESDLPPSIVWKKPL